MTAHVSIAAKLTPTAMIHVSHTITATNAK
jgi:hypothetical protein